MIHTSTLLVLALVALTQARLFHDGKCVGRSRHHRHNWFRCNDNRFRPNTDYGGNSRRTNVRTSKLNYCEWSINKDLPTIQPLYINPRGPKSLLGFWLPQHDDIVSVPVGNEVLLACPGSTVNKIGMETALLTCVGGKELADANGKHYGIGTLGCSLNPTHKALRRIGAFCEIAGRYSLIDIGFVLSNGDFWPIIETCFDDDNLNSLYSRYTLSIKNYNHKSNSVRPKFEKGDFYPINLDVEHKYSRLGQIDSVAVAVGSVDLAKKYINSSDFSMVRGHFASKVDFVYSSHQDATFFYINAAPQWQTFNNGNWKKMETCIRSFARNYKNNLEVYTGSHGTTTLADIKGNEVPIYIAYDENNNGIIKAPALFWRVVYDPITGLGVAFIGLNNPHIKVPGTDFYKCENVCSKITWINWKELDQKSGYSYCCQVSAAAHFIGEIPKLPDSGLLGV